MCPLAVPFDGDADHNEEESECQSDGKSDENDEPNSKVLLCDVVSTCSHLEEQDLLTGLPEEHIGVLDKN